jgi:predicted transcriptional regulator
MLVCALGSKESGEVFSQIVALAIQWAKMRIRKEIKLDEQKIENVEDGINQIKERLNRFSTINTKCNNISKLSSELQEIVTDLKDDIHGLIKKIQSSIISISDRGENNDGP